LKALVSCATSRARRRVAWIPALATFLRRTERDPSGGSFELASERSPDRRFVVSRIFITYRREDASAQAGRLYDWLGDHYGRDAVFKDVDSIDPGRPWRQAIDSAVGSSDVVIALIGPRWLPELDERSGGDDFVRYELEQALATDKRVIPLLVNGASMPTAEQLPPTLVDLTQYQGFDLSDTRFRSDMDELLQRLDRIIERPGETTPPEETEAVKEAPVPPPPPPPPPPDPGLEAELKKWNWGAFLLTFIWGIGNGVMRSFLVFVPFYGFYEWFMLGIHGNRWAWEKRPWESVEKFHQSQRSWAKWGIIVTSVVVGLYFLALAGSSGSG
jgi:TIR domain